MSDYYDDTVFDEEPEDDLDTPEDGRDGTPPEGSSDAPETMHEIDPLHKHRYLLDDDLEAPEEVDNDDLEIDPEEEQVEVEEDDGLR